MQTAGGFFPALRERVAQSPLAGSVCAAIERLLPSKLRDDPAERRRAIRVVAFCMAMGFWAPIFWAVYEFLVPCRPCANTIALAGFLVLFIPALQRRTQSVCVGGNALTLLAAATFTTVAIFTGGCSSPAAVWFVSLPIIATVTIDLRSGVFWSVASVLVISAFFIYEECFGRLTTSITPHAFHYLQYTALAGIIFCVLGLTLTFKSLEEHARRKLSIALDQAQAADRAKMHFLANMSHEIRTPMTAILGFAENLLDPDLTRAEQTSAIETIRRNAEHLTEIINDILDISKIEADKIEIEKLRCRPIEIVQDVVTLMKVRADARHLKLAVRCEGPLPETIETDPTRLRQVLTNLVGNALKFTERGGVTVTCRLLQEEASPRFEIQVADTGIGMTPEQLPRLFQAFHQGDNSMTRRFGGTGLGLAISKRLAELMGGTISVASVRGAGSTFTATVATGPLEGIMLADASVVSAPVSAVAGNCSLQLAGRVLLAEDGLDNQRLLSFMLKKAGVEVVLACNGAEAIDRHEESVEQQQLFDVILMDMQMPVMDGYAATAELRRLGCRLPIVALTAHAMKGDREQCLSAGCDEYLTKPVDRARLLEIVAQAMLGSAARAE
jgi:signal transduction histidine kinase/ActR/RegA family two-component response regulator